MQTGSRTRLSQEITEEFLEELVKGRSSQALSEAAQPAPTSRASQHVSADLSAMPPRYFRLTPSRVIYLE